jgi:hypothetical protein
MLSEASYHNMTVGRIPSVEGGIQPTIVDAKGDLIAAVAADSLNRLAVGSNDQVLVADSAASTGLAWKSYGAQVVAGKNAVINGAFDIWQRGTTSATTAFAYTADRWLKNSATHYNASRQVTGDTTNLPTVQYCARVQRTASSAVTTLIEFTTPFETTNSIPFAGQTITYSFYARRGANYSSASNILSSSVYTGTGTDQTVFGYTGLTQAVTGNATLTTTWQRFSYTGTLSAATNELSVYFAYTPTGTAGAADFFEVTGVQVEVGSVATPFSRNSATIQGELAACQRYYVRYTAGASNYTFLNQGGFYNSTTNYLSIHTLPVAMRVPPTAVDYSALRTVNSDNNAYTVSAITLSEWGTLSGYNNVTTTTATSLRWAALSANNSSSAYVGFSAEL